MSGKGEDGQGDGDRGTLKALALATQLGFAVAGPLVVFIAAGVWADGQFGTKPWFFFVGLILGIGSAGAALYQIATSLPTRPYTPPAKKVGGSAPIRTDPPTDKSSSDSGDEDERSGD